MTLTRLCKLMQIIICDLVLLWQNWSNYLSLMPYFSVDLGRWLLGATLGISFIFLLPHSTANSLLLNNINYGYHSKEIKPEKKYKIYLFVKQLRISQINLYQNKQAGVQLHCHYSFLLKRPVRYREMFFLHGDIITFLGHKQAATANSAHSSNILKDNFVSAEIHHFAQQPWVKRMLQLIQNILFSGSVNSINQKQGCKGDFSPF